MGSFAAVDDSAGCIECITPLYNNYTAATMCHVCIEGNARVNAHTCQQCTAGTYAPSKGDVVCKTCENPEIAANDGAMRCTLCKAGQYWQDAQTCRICAPGTYLSQDNTQCLLCSAIRQDYCNDTHVEIQDLPWDEEDKISFQDTCNSQQFSIPTEPLCRRCGCSLFQDALTPANAHAISCDNTQRYYLDGATHACEYCPVNKHINNHPAHRSCDDPDIALEHQEWNGANSRYECVPGYFRASPSTAICMPCELDKYQDEPEQGACKECTSNTKTYNTASISVHDCSFCGYDRYLLQSASDGTFSCIECAMCSVQPHAVHMQQTCSACGFHDYDKKTNPPGTASHGKFCVLANCLSTVRTDDFVYNTGWGSALIPPLYEIQPTTAFGNMNSAFLTTLSDTANKDPLQTFDQTFQATTLPWWEDIASQTKYAMPTFDTAMQGNMDLGNSRQEDRVYVSFVDLFFRIMMQRVKATISTTGVISSLWQESDSVAYKQKTRQIVSMYNPLYEKYLQARDTLDFRAITQVSISCTTLGARTTSIEFSVPGTHVFEFTAIVSFADEQLSPADCGSSNTACRAFFAHNANYLTFSNQKNRIVFADLSRFVLQDISFEIHRATGHNEIDVAIKYTTNADTVVNLKMHWKRNNANYYICQPDDSPAKRALITDPWAFSKIRKQLLPSMCTNVNYM